MNANIFNFQGNSYCYMKKIFLCMFSEENICFSHVSKNIHTDYIKYKKIYNKPMIYRPSELLTHISQLPVNLETILFSDMIERTDHLTYIREIGYKKIYEHDEICNKLNINNNINIIIIIIGDVVFIGNLCGAMIFCANNIKYIIPHDSLMLTLKPRYSHNFITKYISNFLTIQINNGNIFYITDEIKNMSVKIPSSFYINRVLHVLNMCDKYKKKQLKLLSIIEKNKIQINKSIYLLNKEMKYF